MPFCSCRIVFNWTTNVWRVKVGYSADILNAPRALFEELRVLGKRAVWCHQNCQESITLYAPPCLLCMIASIVFPVAVISVWVYPLVRFVYIGAYVGVIPSARGLCLALGILCSTLFYKEGLTVLLFS